MLETLAKVFFATLRKKIVYSRKLYILNHYHCIHYSLLRATTSCRPGVRQENGTAHLPFPLASEGEASPQPNTMVLQHILAPAAGTA
jgi:hypothetical protein